MIRIFLTLAILSLALLAITLGMGLMIGDLSAETVDQTVSDVTRGRFRVHFLLGVFSALVVVLVNSIGMTYFIGTSRWCKEVTETYQLDMNHIRRGNQIKRQAFPWALCGMLTIVGVIALGASSDPATGIKNTAHWRDYHLAAALAGTALIGYCFYMLWTKINDNQDVIQAVMDDVKQIRHERGLDEAEPAEMSAQSASK